MQFRINFEADSLDELTRYALFMMEAVVLMNMDWLQLNPDAPRDIQRSGVMYDPPPLDFRTNTHRICHAELLLQQGHGKCDSIVAYDVAARRLNGQNARVAARPQTNDGLYHIVTEVAVHKGSSPQYIDISRALQPYHGPDSCRNLIAQGSYCDC